MLTMFNVVFMFEVTDKHTLLPRIIFLYLQIYKNVFILMTIYIINFDGTKETSHR